MSAEWICRAFICSLVTLAPKTAFFLSWPVCTAFVQVSCTQQKVESGYDVLWRIQNGWRHTLGMHTLIIPFVTYTNCFLSASIIESISGNGAAATQLGMGMSALAGSI